jgi:hypothetical protein
MRRAVLGIVALLAAAGCTASDVAPGALGEPGLQVRPTESPYVRVTAGQVSGLVPEGWQPIVYSAAAPREGFFASPHPQRWGSIDGRSTGIAASWVDATEVGLPSDMYYMAAAGPLLARLAASGRCTTEHRVIVADHVPSFADGEADSPGDFIAQLEGTCRPARAPQMRWSYFIAAPGFGPTTTIGIPGSGLYVAVAVTRDSAQASSRLTRLLRHVRFGEAAIADFVRAARRPVPV